MNAYTQHLKQKHTKARFHWEMEDKIIIIFGEQRRLSGGQSTAQNMAEVENEINPKDLPSTYDINKRIDDNHDIYHCGYNHITDTINHLIVTQN